MQRVGQMTLGPLVVLTHVEQQRRLVRAEERLRRGGVDLLDLGSDLCQEVSVAVHFQKYS